LGGTFHLKLNTTSSPIANKYREGKVQSTLERELNVPETAVMQAYGTCAWLEDWESLGCHAVGQWANACSCCLFTLKIPPLILWRLPTRVHARSKAYRCWTFGSNAVVRTVRGLRLCGRELSLGWRAGSVRVPTGRSMFTKVFR
jgi:hypothetical protein